MKRRAWNWSENLLPDQQQRLDLKFFGQEQNSLKNTTVCKTDKIHQNVILNNQSTASIIGLWYLKIHLRKLFQCKLTPVHSYSTKKHARQYCLVLSEENTRTTARSISKRNFLWKPRTVTVWSYCGIQNHWNKEIHRYSSVWNHIWNRAICLRRWLRIKLRLVWLEW